MEEVRVYLYMYLFFVVPRVSVCERKRERKGERGQEGDKERSKEGLRDG